MDGETWSVVDSAPVAPGDTALVHNILIRKGVAVDIAAIESRRQDIKRRMAALDRMSTSDARALDKAITEMCAL